MPELSEAETNHRDIEPCLAGVTIMHTTVCSGRLHWPVSGGIYRLSDQPVLNIQWHARYLLLKLADDWVIIHLGMSGSLRIFPEELPADERDHVDLMMSDGKVLRYTDSRCFGAQLQTKELDGYNVLAHLGSEPLSDDFNANYLQQKCTRKKTATKLWLADNKLMVDVSNIYASESPFAVGIYPDRLTSSLSKDGYELLVHVIGAVLLRSIEQGGATLKDSLQSDGKPGYFTREPQVYGGEDEPCRVCGVPIVATKRAQYTTFYCRHCQKQFHCWSGAVLG